MWRLAFTSTCLVSSPYGVGSQDKGYQILGAGVLHR